jgi:hypothetical protein
MILVKRHKNAKDNSQMAVAANTIETLRVNSLIFEDLQNAYSMISDRMPVSTGSRSRGRRRDQLRMVGR